MAINHEFYDEKNKHPKSVKKSVLTFANHFGIIYMKNVETQDGCHDTS